MQRTTHFLYRYCLGALLLLASLSAVAQANRPVTYEFMTVSIVKSPYKNDCYMLLTPAFQGKAEVKLEEEYNLASDRYRANLQRNTALLTTTLGELSAAGWELADVHSTEVGAAPPGLQATATITRYLLRKAKN